MRPDTRSSALILRPQAASSAGMRVSPASSASRVVAMPPTASEVNVGSPNANKTGERGDDGQRGEGDRAPGGGDGRSTASGTSGPAPRSSRNRLTISRL